ncbi:ROK family protein [Kitasatospora aureofaciens]|uniref:Sugar kinase n=1 Tax=Kitasatospora aureofaciens TaxID=1894 RepID=A0A1E7N414_KITAU|nr:ROK family protein [Kitasatospora aureofaciens]OEV35426.1 sugar kinase [Kitasatospora aureofaciens]GGV04102.1 sugar kinase [Kitasatospora aureofaciens]
MTRVIALDVGGTYIKGGAAGEDGVLRETDRWFTGAERGPDAVLETVLSAARELADRHRPAAAGIAVPGIVDEAAGAVVLAANLGWHRLPVRDWLAEELGLPVALGHDVRAGGLAEARIGAGRGSRDFLFVPVGTGIAAALMSDGQSVTGSHARAGELGHLVVRPGGPACPCGGRGCLETVASAAAIARRYTAATGEGGVTAKDVGERAVAGDQTAVMVWNEAIEALADALTAAITLLDPERIVIGGGLARAGDPYFAPLRAAVAERLTFQTLPQLLPAQLGHEAGCQGAALLAHDLLAHDLPHPKVSR